MGKLGIVGAVVFLIGSADAQAGALRLDRACSQKNQGALGTCHAFALTCPIEAFESKRRPGFEVSENWLVFVSTLDRLCTGRASKNGKVRVNKGYSSELDLRRTMSLGYCAKSTFSKYDRHDYSRGATPTSSESFTTATAPSGDAGESELGGGSLQDELDIERMLEEDDGQKELGIGEEISSDEDTSTTGDGTSFTAARGSRRGGYMTPNIARKFARAFGIRPEDAKAALCSGTDQQKRARLSTMNVSRGFRACFEEALKSRSQLRSCQPSFTDGRMSDARKIAQLKALLRSGEPVMISMTNYVKRRDGKHGNHAISIVGYDDARRQFLVRNSWGEGRNYPISYARVRNIGSFGSMGCPDSTRRDYARGEEELRPHAVSAPDNALASTSSAHWDSEAY